jgi:hypothetical protein
MNRSTSRASTPPAIAAVGSCERNFRWTTSNRPDRLDKARRNESSGEAIRSLIKLCFVLDFTLASSSAGWEPGSGSVRTTAKEQVGGAAQQGESMPKTAAGSFRVRCLVVKIWMVTGLWPEPHGLGLEGIVLNLL